MMTSSSAPAGVRDLLTRLVAIGEHLRQNGHRASGTIFRWELEVQLDQILQVTACNALEPPKWFSNIERCIKDFNRVAERDMLNIRTQAQMVVEEMEAKGETEATGATEVKKKRVVPGFLPRLPQELKDHVMAVVYDEQCIPLQSHQQWLWDTQLALRQSGDLTLEVWLPIYFPFLRMRETR